MSGPAKSGAMLYASNLHSLKEFYVQVIGFRPVHETPELIVLSHPDTQLILHQSPVELSVEKPAEERYCTLKLFFTVSSLASVSELISSLGGRIKPEVWEGNGFFVSNVVDPEGNVFHLRWPMG